MSSVFSSIWTCFEQAFPCLSTFYRGSQVNPAEFGNDQSHDHASGFTQADTNVNLFEEDASMDSGNDIDDAQTANSIVNGAYDFSFPFTPSEIESMDMDSRKQKALEYIIEKLANQGSISNKAKITKAFGITTGQLGR